MSVKYIPFENTKVVIGGNTYQNNGDKIAILPVEKLKEDELKRLLDMKFIKKLEVDESGSPTVKKDKDPLKKMSLDELVAKAIELEIQADNTMKPEELIQKIKEAQKQG